MIRELAVAGMNPRGAFELADMVAGGSMGAILMGRASIEAAREVGPEDDDTSKGGPKSKIAKIAATAGSLGQIQRFEATASRTVVTHWCELSLRSVAPGIRWRGNFSELTGREHFAPSEEVVLARPVYISAGRILQMYLQHLEKARLLLGRSLEWRTKAVVPAARGLARAVNRIREPKPAVSQALFAKIVSSNPFSDALVQAVWVFWAFLLRVPSECLTLVSQLPRDKMGEGPVLE